MRKLENAVWRHERAGELFVRRGGRTQCERYRTSDHRRTLAEIERARADSRSNRRRHAL